MKRHLYLLVIMLVFASSTKAQMILTSGGFRDPSDTTKNFVVFDIVGKGKRQLFNEALSTINKSVLLDAKKRNIDTVGGASVHINGETTPKTISPGTMLYYWKYAVTFSFKDEKVKFEVDKLIFEEKGSAGESFKIHNPKKRTSKYQAIFGYQEELINPKAKENIELFVNDIINKTLKGIKDWDSW